MWHWWTKVKLSFAAVTKMGYNFHHKVSMQIGAKLFFLFCVLILQLFKNLIIKCHKAIMDAIMVSYPWTSCQILQAEQGSMDRTKFLAKLPNFPCYARIMAIIKWQTMLKQVCSSLNIILNTTNDSINNI